MVVESIRLLIPAQSSKSFLRLPPPRAGRLFNKTSTSNFYMLPLFPLIRNHLKSFIDIPTLLYFRATCAESAGEGAWLVSRCVWDPLRAYFYCSDFFVSCARYGQDLTLLWMVWIPLIFWIALLDRLLFDPLSISQLNVKGDWSSDKIHLHLNILNEALDSILLWSSMFWDLPLFALFQLDSPRLPSWCRWAAEACLISSVSTPSQSNWESESTEL